MKKGYAILCMLLFGGLAYGQNTDPHKVDKADRKRASAIFNIETTGNAKASDVYLKPSAVAQRAAGCAADTVFYEDFANGLNGNSGFGAWDTTGANSQYWEHDFDGPDNFNVDSLDSPTASNGHMIFDFFDKVPPPGGSTPDGVPVEGYLESPVIDLSSAPNARIEFHTHFYHCCSNDFEIELEVSTDGGSNWSTSLNISEGIDRNEYPGNPYVLGYDLSDAISADPSNVKIRFSWDASSPDGNGQYSSAYWLTVDDVVIKYPDRNDLEIGQTSYFPTNGTFPIHYRVIPLSQTYDMDLGAVMCNIGQNDFANSMVNAVVDEDAAGQVFSNSSPAVTVPAGECYDGPDTGPHGDTVAVTPPYQPSALGQYEVSYDVSSSDTADCDPSDNVGESHRFNVSNGIYARDAYDETGNINDILAGPPAGGGTYKALATYNLYEFFADDTIESISFYVTEDSTENGAGPITASITSANPFNRDSVVEGIGGGEVKSSPFYIDDSDNATDTGWVTLSLNTKLEVSAGDYYYAKVRYEGGSLNFSIGQSGLHHGWGISIWGDFGGSGEAFYSTENVPMVRLNTTNSPMSPVAVNEEDQPKGFDLGQNRPNPFNGSTIIPYTLGKAADVRFEVYDIAGKRVMDKDQGHQNSGRHQLRIGGQDLDAGVYYYSLIVNDQKQTRKMVITR